MMTRGQVGVILCQCYAVGGEVNVLLQDLLPSTSNYKLYTVCAWHTLHVLFSKDKK